MLQAIEPVRAPHRRELGLVVVGRRAPEVEPRIAEPPHGGRGSARRRPSAARVAGSWIAIWPQATSWPASRARTVSHASRATSGSAGSSSSATAPAGSAPTRNSPDATSTPSCFETPREPQGGQVAEHVPVLDPDPPAGARDPHRLEHLLELDQPRRRRPVGEQQPVDAEVAVVHDLAEVAAVRERAVVPPQTVVDPLPDEAALAARMALEQRVVVGQAAGPVAHRVRVLAQHERPVAVAPDRVDLRVRRVHAAVDVAARRIALVVHRPRRVALPRPRRHRRQVPPRRRSRCRATT